MIERLTRYYEHENSNIHRAAHALAARSTDAYEAAREKTRRILNAGSTEEIVVTWMELHANIAPWHQWLPHRGHRQGPRRRGPCRALRPSLRPAHPAPLQRGIHGDASRRGGERKSLSVILSASQGSFSLKRPTPWLESPFAKAQGDSLFLI
nr:aminotransferase class V-fold PLP-dependent enzyme [Paramagnetospirillum magneticum]